MSMIPCLICESKAQRTLFVPFLANLSISNLLWCPYFTQCISHTLGAVKTVTWGMTQYIRWWGWYQFENRKMSVNLKLNGPVSLNIWLIFLFHMQFHAHLPWNVPKIVASSQYTDICEMTQNIGRWAWYQVGNSKMSVTLKLNGPLLRYFLLIFLFHFRYQIIFHAMQLE
jgi:hypothetical protein